MKNTPTFKSKEPRKTPLTYDQQEALACFKRACYDCCKVPENWKMYLKIIWQQQDMSETMVNAWGRLTDRQKGMLNGMPSRGFTPAWLDGYELPEETTPSDTTMDKISQHYQQALGRKPVIKFTLVKLDRALVLQVTHLDDRFFAWHARFNNKTEEIGTHSFRTVPGFDNSEIAWTHYLNGLNIRIGQVNFNKPYVIECACLCRGDRSVDHGEKILLNALQRFAREHPAFQDQQPAPLPPAGEGVTHYEF